MAAWTLSYPVPIRAPALNGMVMGQDTVRAAIYRGNIFWLWGDTDRPNGPLGNFNTTAATSELPGQGGLDPALPPPPRNCRAREGSTPSWAWISPISPVRKASSSR